MYLSRETILNIALGIERAGIEFYEKARDRFGGELADYLVGEEQKHIRVFEEIFGEGDTGVTVDRIDTPHLDNDYLAAAYAGTEVFAAIDLDSVSESGLYDVAIAMEKNSVMFYAELIDAMGESFAAEAELLAGIQDEERKHLRALAEKKKALAL